MSDNIKPQPDSLEPTTVTTCAKLTLRQVALVTAWQPVSYILYGEPLPQTFDRNDLKIAAVELGKMLAELEVPQ